MRNSHLIHILLIRVYLLTKYFIISDANITLKHQPASYMKHNTCINKYERIQSHSRSDYLSYLNRRTKLKPRKDYKILSSRSDLFQDSSVHIINKIIIFHTKEL
ncbi:hypothetical protein JYU34_001601 [Plutella xylostella]|uniref:Secreted protein n=2 Tax=Plutella xylostella TaxID=51655 RepID=A0ABQ7R4C1_PLUXY|nr:hypothetical protein JYU34_016699 [Plutella xylostella]KAG7310846.1 hypothetical protein JYU34_003676 [Plutella xylostella]KAG7312139.1 hypothetical protein JYU34_001601 [Plutella xylostella]